MKLKQTHLENYYLTEDGKVYSDRDISRKKELIEIKPKLNKGGYVYIHPYYANMKRTYIRLHRWIWETFRGEIPKGYEIHHKDHNKLNNSLDNLELVTHRENILKYLQYKKEQQCQQEDQ
jgi:hypothetical protein